MTIFFKLNTLLNMYRYLGTNNELRSLGLKASELLWVTGQVRGTTCCRITSQYRGIPWLIHIT